MNINTRRNPNKGITFLCPHPACEATVALPFPANGPVDWRLYCSACQARLRLRRKATPKFFDVFLCHNAKDKPEVRQIADKLKERDIRPWLDESELQPGLPWPMKLEEQIESINAAAVFLGPNGIGHVQELERLGLLDDLLQRQRPVIPVILSTCQETPEIPLFLRCLMWVDFRESNPDPLEQLIWGILGRHCRI